MPVRRGLSKVRGSIATLATQFFWPETVLFKSKVILQKESLVLIKTSLFVESLLSY